MATTAPPNAASESEEATLAPGHRSGLQRWRGPIGSLILFVLLYAMWDVTVRLEVVSDIILPAPGEVAIALVQTVADGFFYAHLWVTVQEVLIGFAVGALIGFVLGAILGISRLAREVAYPYVVAFQGLPKIVLAPVFLTAFGFGMMSKIVMAIVISFFPLLVNTELGFATVDPDALKLMRSMRASKRDILFKLTLPHSLPLIFAGLKASLTFALVGALVGEFVGASRGLGYLLDVYVYQLQVPRVWAITVILALFGLLLFVLVDVAHRKLVFWQHNPEDVGPTL